MRWHAHASSMHRPTWLLPLCLRLLFLGAGGSSSARTRERRLIPSLLLGLPGCLGCKPAAAGSGGGALTLPTYFSFTPPPAAGLEQRPSLPTVRGLLRPAGRLCTGCDSACISAAVMTPPPRRSALFPSCLSPTQAPSGWASRCCRRAPLGLDTRLVSATPRGGAPCATHPPTLLCSAASCRASILPQILVASGIFGPIGTNADQMMLRRAAPACWLHADF